jgi:hypothetical protein
MSNRAVATMQGKTSLLLSILICLCCSNASLAADSKAAATNLTAAQIVEKHVAARGGQQAWRAVQTLSVTGKMEAGSGDSAARSARLARQGTGASAKRAHAEAAAGADKVAADEQVQLPFTLEMKRPGKSRLEIEFAGNTAVQVYDGVNGWKLRPYLNRSDVEPFTATEAKSEAGKGELDGPLVDYVTKGTKVTLEGSEPVDGHDAYKLMLKMKNGDVQHIWIDAQSFLDVKVEGIPRQFDGKLRKVWIYQRDFRSIQGLMVPYLYDTAIEGSAQTHKMIIHTVSVNRALDDSRFAKPQARVAGSAVPTGATGASMVANK